MNKLAIIPIFFLSMCGTAPITDQPAAQAYPSDDFCLRSKWVDKCDPKPLIPKEQVKGEIDITSPYHLQSLQMMFQRNVRKGQIEKNATLPSDAINNALDNFWEQENGSNGSTEQEKLL